MIVLSVVQPREMPLPPYHNASYRCFYEHRLQKFSEEELVVKFGSKTGEWLWRICRGMDDEPVTPNLKPKSLSVCKSFA